MTTLHEHAFIATILVIGLALSFFAGYILGNVRGRARTRESLHPMPEAPRDSEP